MVLFRQYEYMKMPAKSQSLLDSSWRKGRSISAPIPSFALYGEAAQPGQEMLHIEEVQSRSRLHHWEIQPHVHQGLYQVLGLRKGQAQVLLDEQRSTARGPVAIVVPPGVVHGFRFARETDGLVLTLSARFLVEGEFQSIGDAFGQLFSAPGVLALGEENAMAARLDGLFAELAAEFLAPGNSESPVPGWLARAVIWRLAQARVRASLGTRRA